jgi:hypothetical protein
VYVCQPVAFHDGRQIFERQSDPVVRHTVLRGGGLFIIAIQDRETNLRVIIRPNLFAAVGRVDEVVSDRALLGHLFRQLHVQQPGTEDLKGSTFILVRWKEVNKMTARKQQNPT